MPRRLRKQWHAQNESPGCGRFAAGCGLFLTAEIVLVFVISILGTIANDLAGLGALLAFPVLLALLPSLIRGSLRAGITTDDEELCEWYPCGWRRRVRWVDFVAAEVSDQRAVLTHPRGQVVLEPPLADWAQIAGQAQRHLGQAPVHDSHEDDVLALPPEEVAAWLGIARDGELVCTTRFHRRWLWWLVAPLLVVGMLFVPGLFWLVLVGIYATGLTAVTGRRRDRRIHEVRATPDGLDVRSDAGWRKHAWGGLKRLSKTGLFWVVNTTEGDLWLPPGLTHDQLLLHGIREAIRARREGWALPRMTGDVPVTALSRASGAILAGDRGLSPAAGQDQLGEAGSPADEPAD